MDENDAEQGTRALRVRLPGFVNDEDVGLGDALKRVSYIVGIKPCGGCDKRAAALNRWIIFSAKR
jgi:hypothetical protein